MRIVISVVMFTLLGLALLRRRWAYVAFVALSLLRIPSRTGFDLVRPACELSPTGAQLAASLDNVPHILLFAVFFIVTAVQFRGQLRSRIGWPVLISTLFGAIIELEQGATRTGNCDLHDLVPNAIGILLGALATELWRWGVKGRAGPHPGD